MPPRKRIKIGIPSREPGGKPFYGVKRPRDGRVSIMPIPTGKPYDKTKEVDKIYKTY